MRPFWRWYQSVYSGLPREAWQLAGVMFVNRSGTMVLFFLSLYITEVLGYSISTAGLMISIYGLGSLSGALVGGWLNDAWGTRQVQFTSLTLAGLGFIGLSYLEGLPEIGVMLFVTALVAETLRPANSAALAAVCPPEKHARGFALLRLASNLGIAIGPAVGGILALRNYQLIFWADGLTCLAAALLFFFLFRKTVVFDHLARRREALPPERQPWKDGVFVFVLILLFCAGLLFVQLFNTWPVYLREVYRLTERHIGSLMALNGLLIVLAEMPLVHRLEQHNPVRVMALAVLLMFAGFAVLPLGRNYGFAALTVLIWSIGEMLLFPIISGFVANRAGEKNRGKYMGMFTFAFSLSFIVGPITGTGVYDHFGPTALWLGAGVLGILCSLGFLGLDRVLASHGKL